MIAPDPYLLAEVDTFAPLHERRDDLAGLAERLRAELEPLARGDGERVEAELDLISAGGVEGKSVRHGERTWRLAMDGLRSGKLDSVDLNVYRPGAGAAGFGVEARAGGGEADVARRINLRLSPQLVGGRIDADLQERFVRLAVDVAVELEAVSGYITLDHLHGMNPYEAAVHADPEETLRRAHELVHGYSWGTFLSTSHVERLGGVERVRSAPVLAVEELPGGLVYLQLTADVQDLPEDVLRAWRSFLEPLLPQGRGRSPFDWYTPLGLLPEDLAAS